MLLLLFLITIIQIINCTTFYVDPLKGNINNPGTKDSPFSTLKDLIDYNKIETMTPAVNPWDFGDDLKVKNLGAPIKAGDVIKLLPGDHGEEINIQAYVNQDYITIEGEEGVFVGRFRIISSQKWIVRDITVSPSLFGSTWDLDYLFTIQSHGYMGPVAHVMVENINAYTVKDHQVWNTGEDWLGNACDCFIIDGYYVTVRNIHCKNIAFGFVVWGRLHLIEDCIVENFAGDGLRALGDDILFQRNRVINCYHVSGNHDDMFQSWQTSTTPRINVTLRQNFFLTFTDSTRDFIGPTQGFGLFDGWYEDFIIEENLVAVSHVHGVAVTGARNSIVRYNTVVDPVIGDIWLDMDTWYPYQRFFDHKDGTPSTNCKLTNGLGSGFACFSMNDCDINNYVIPATEESYQKEYVYKGSMFYMWKLKNFNEEMMDY